jgi:hypothetical protein
VRRAQTRLAARAWALGLVAHLFLFATLSNLSVHEPLHAFVQERFWQQAVAVLAVFVGLGLAHAASWLPRGLSRPALPLLALGLPAALVATQWRAMDQHEHVYFREYGRAILESLPERAILLITSDEAVGAARYLQQIEGLRRDVRVLPSGQVASAWFRRLAPRHFPEVVFPRARAAGDFTFREFLDSNAGTSRVFLLNKVPWEQTLEEAYRAVPAGLADEVIPKSANPPLERWVADSLASFGRFDPASYGVHAGVWERYVEAGYWKQYERFGLAVARSAAGRGEDPAIARTVIRALEPLAQGHPSPNPAILKNLGVAYQFLARTDPQAAPRMLEFWKRYLAVGPRSDPDRAAIQALVAAAEAKRP